MVQKALLASKTYNEPISMSTNDLEKNYSKDMKLKMFNKIFKSERKLVSSRSLNCLAETQEELNKCNEVTENVNDTINSNLIHGLYERKCKSLNEIYFLQKSVGDGKLEFEHNQKKSISTSKIEKCVRFNDDITVKELNDEYDRRPMPLAKMYYKDQVELSQLREEMRQIQYRIINKIEGKVLLGN